MAKKILLFLTGFILFLISGFVLCDYLVLNHYEVTYETKGTDIYVFLHFKYVRNGTCTIKKTTAKMLNNSCSFIIYNEKNDIEIKNIIFSKTIELNPNQEKIIDFNVQVKNKYLIKEEEQQINIDVKKMGNPQEHVNYVSKSENICSVSENGLIKAIGNGICKIEITVDNIKKEIEIHSTDLLIPETFNRRKKSLPCNRYSKEENDLLDHYLEQKIDEAGYQTRAGVVAALRFLTLSFPYQINYFFENGRLNNNTGGAYVDGEGRYYHKGLYLNSDRKSNIIKRFSGPAIWGCPLTNWEEQEGYVRGEKKPNGLDCSGFITWAMYNAGYDPKDTGAGDNTWRDDDLSDIGPHIPITMAFLKQNKLKSGDFIAAQGHAAMVVGITESHVYVAESTVHGNGVNMSKWTYQELVNTNELDYVILMDDYYKKEGNYTNMWE